MNAFTISLTDDAREFVEAEATAGGFGSPETYLLELVRAEQKRKAREKVEEMLLEALKEPSTEMTQADWADLRQKLEDRIEAQLLEGLNTPCEDATPEWWDRFRAELRSRPVADVAK